MELNPFGLWNYRGKVWSQFQEDGITLELVQRLKPPELFLEIGAGNGTENNTHVLLDLGWSGTWVDPALEEWRFGSFTKIPAKATVENPPRFTEEIGVFSLDIDGNDWHLWKAIGGGPQIVVVEFQAQRPFDEPYIMPYDPDYVWDHKSYDCGASLISMIDLGKSLGYTFVGTASPSPNLDSPNAFFVRDDLVPKLGVEAEHVR